MSTLETPRNCCMGVTQWGSFFHDPSNHELFLWNSELNTETSQSADNRRPFRICRWGRVYVSAPHWRRFVQTKKKYSFISFISLLGSLYGFIFTYFISSADVKSLKGIKGTSRSKATVPQDSFSVSGFTAFDSSFHADGDYMNCEVFANLACFSSDLSHSSPWFVEKYLPRPAC